MGKKVLGIDIGIASIGWALLEFEDEKIDYDTGEIFKNSKIIKSGVRIFTEAENPKTGESLAKPRREYRLSRRRLRRRSQRMKKIKNLFIQNKLVEAKAIDKLYIGAKDKKDVWDLRKEALTKKLTAEEFVRVLTSIAKRRGFKSIRKAEESKKEGQLLSAIKENKDKMIKGNFTTVGEMLASQAVKRNKRESYQNSISRELVEEEVRIIFEKQRKLGNKFATENLYQQYRDIAFFQKPIGSVDSMVGSCSWEPDQKRAPKESYSAERFAALQKIVNLKLRDGLGDKRFLSKEEINKVLELCYDERSSSLTYKKIRKELKLEDSIKFDEIDYYHKKGNEEKDPEKAIFFEMKGFHKIRKAIQKNCSPEVWQNLSKDSSILNEIAIAITFKKSDEEIRKYLIDKNIPTEVIDAIEDISMQKVINLSIKAVDKINPFLEQGFKYSEACEKAGYRDSGDQSVKSAILPVPSKEELPKNPVVARAISQFRKIVNAIIREYGNFDQINIELARDLHKSHEERKKIEKIQKTNKEDNDLAKKYCCELLKIDNPSSALLLKFKLWHQQGERCIYSGKLIEPDDLLDKGSCDVDHIIPYSRSLDDSYNNKVLCLASENRQKSNKTPYEYLCDKGWEEFVARINTMHSIPKAKRNRLLTKEYKNDGSFIERNINDTRYIARYIKDYTQKNLDFGHSKYKIGNRVQVRSGMLTSFLRYQWGLHKSRDEGDKHHALDAIVIACSTQAMVNHLAKISEYKEINGSKWLKKNNNSKTLFSLPWTDFKNDLDKSIAEISVSRAVKRKITGSAHEETIRSYKKEQRISVVKTPLAKIDLKSLAENFYNQESSPDLYNILKNRLQKNNDDPKKAFQEPVYMPTKSGKQGPIVRSVKMKQIQNTGVEVRKGIADNGSMIRVDIFSKKDKKGIEKFYYVPIYVSDMIKPELPNIEVKSRKSCDKWLVMDDSFEFKFSIFKNDLIRIVYKDNSEYLGYYRALDIYSGCIKIDYMDRSTQKDSKDSERLNIFSFKIFEKYQIDLLGNYHKVKKENRLGTMKSQ